MGVSWGCPVRRRQCQRRNGENGPGLGISALCPQGSPLTSTKLKAKRSRRPGKKNDQRPLGNTVVSIVPNFTRSTVRNLTVVWDFKEVRLISAN